MGMGDEDWVPVGELAVGSSDGCWASIGDSGSIVDAGERGGDLSAANRRECTTLVQAELTKRKRMRCMRWVTLWEGMAIMLRGNRDCQRGQLLVDLTTGSRSGLHLNHVTGWTATRQLILHAAIRRPGVLYSWVCIPGRG